MDANRPPWSMNDLVRARSERGTGEVPPQLLSLESSRSVVVPTASAREQTPQITSASPLGEDHVRLALNTEVLTSVPGTMAERVPAAELAAVGGAFRTESGPRPDWAGLSYLPSPSVPATPDVLRRFNGRLVDPSICEAHLFNGDNRTEYWPSGYPWHAVGKLFVWADAANPTHSWIATGALVGRNVVLTASHAFPWNSPNWGIKFVPAFYDSASILGTSVSSWVGSARGYQEHAQGNDMVVLRLYDPLGDWLGWFGSRTYNGAWEDQPFWTFCGYPCDRANATRPHYQAGIPVIDDDSEGSALEIEHKGDEADGMSGGPLFGWWNGSPDVIGTHSGVEKETVFSSWQSVAAGGSALVSWAQQNW
jgi:V8-like Glu-specific endopeptidase